MKHVLGTDGRTTVRCTELSQIEEDALQGMFCSLGRQAGDKPALSWLVRQASAPIIHVQVPLSLTLFFRGQFNVAS
jgi:hypothetical protein